MDLYCWPHNTVHPFTPGQVEQIVYCLTGQLGDAEQAGPIQNPQADPRFACPKDVLYWARDSEAYLEHVEQGVECRKAMAQ